MSVDLNEVNNRLYELTEKITLTEAQKEEERLRQEAKRDLRNFRIRAFIAAIIVGAISAFVLNNDFLVNTRFYDLMWTNALAGGIFVFGSIFVTAFLLRRR